MGIVWGCFGDVIVDACGMFLGCFWGCLGDVSRTFQECLGNVSGNTKDKTRQHKADGTEGHKAEQSEHYQVKGRGASNMFPDTSIFASMFAIFKSFVC